MEPPDVVVGVDGAGKGWVAVVLVGGAATEVIGVKSLPDLDRALSASSWVPAVIAVDIPLNLPDWFQRRADTLVLQLRTSGWNKQHAATQTTAGTLSSPFITPPWEAIKTAIKVKSNRPAEYAQWRQQHQPPPGPRTWDWDNERWSGGIEDQVASAEYWLNGRKAAGLVVEFFPEFSFYHMSQKNWPVSKRHWNGHQQRRSLLDTRGINLSNLRVKGYNGRSPTAATDDVLDAAAGAWTALRVQRKAAISCPPRPENNKRGGTTAIWA